MHMRVVRVCFLYRYSAVEKRFEQLRNCVSPGDSGPSPSNLRSRYGRTEMHIEWHSKDCTDVLMYTILVGEEYW